MGIRAIAGAGLALALASLPAAAGADLRVRGDKLVDRGRVVQLRGVNRSGLEYACIQGWGFFDSPHPDRIDDPAMISAMKRWEINAVRVPLNEDCWLGVNSSSRFVGGAYRRIVRKYVRALNAAHLYVILDLHWAAPGSTKADGQTRMADADHSPAFWRSVASTFKRDHAVVFDLFSEPNGIGWSCWRNGCRVSAQGRFPSYRAAGMQALVKAVRSTGARQPLMLGGVDYSGNVSGWLRHEPHDPRHQLVAAEHNYGTLAPCTPGCKAAILATHKHVPVVLGELGETDCAQGYVDHLMPWADSHGISYLGWAWNVASCTGEPSLIKSYSGVPTGFGVGFRDHLQALGTPFRP